LGVPEEEGQLFQSEIVRGVFLPALSTVDNIKKWSSANGKLIRRYQVDKSCLLRIGLLKKGRRNLLLFVLFWSNFFVLFRIKKLQEPSSLSHKRKTSRDAD